MQFDRVYQARAYFRAFFDDLCAAVRRWQVVDGSSVGMFLCKLSLIARVGLERSSLFSRPVRLRQIQLADNLPRLGDNCFAMFF
jgi:hypothetical protein